MCGQGQTSSESSIVQRLMEVIEERKKNPTATSYTAQLFAGGVTAIGRKVTEEAEEVVEAAGEPGESGRDHLVREVADLVYHVLVLLAACQRRWSDVEKVLTDRFGTSGIQEKESRRK
jgi:phosphoribosyl-ATP pyrophosphohydrolase